MAISVARLKHLASAFNLPLCSRAIFPNSCSVIFLQSGFQTAFICKSQNQDES